MGYTFVCLLNLRLFFWTITREFVLSDLTVFLLKAVDETAFWGLFSSLLYPLNACWLIWKLKLSLVEFSVSSRLIGRKEFVENKEMVQEGSVLFMLALLGEIKSQRSNSLKSFLLEETSNIKTEKTQFFETLQNT